MFVSDRSVVFSKMLDVCQFSPSTLVASTNKTDRRDLSEILLKVALNNIIPNPIPKCLIRCNMQTLYLYFITFVGVRPRTI